MKLMSAVIAVSTLLGCGVSGAGEAWTCTILSPAGQVIFKLRVDGNKLIMSDIPNLPLSILLDSGESLVAAGAADNPMTGFIIGVDKKKNTATTSVIGAGGASVAATLPPATGPCVRD